MRSKIKLRVWLTRQQKQFKVQKSNSHLIKNLIEEAKKKTNSMNKHLNPLYPAEMHTRNRKENQSSLVTLKEIMTIWLNKEKVE